MASTGTLEKLTIISFSDAKLQKPKNTFVAMFNPSTFSVNSSNAFDENKEPGKGKADQKPLHREPRSLSVELFFDGTGASPTSNGKTADISKFGDFSAGSDKFSVKDSDNKDDIVTIAVNKFLETAYKIDGDQHRPLFLVFVWGTFFFPCVLESANTTFSLFSSDGKPLRAKISISAKEHITELKLNAELRLNSPDLTHSRTIIAGDTLPNLAQKIYGDESLYLEVAKANNLHNYRKLKPGTQLIFPPIERVKTRG